MKKELQELDRRDFLKTLAVAGAGSMLVGQKAGAQEQAEAPAKPTAEMIPTRPYGKSGINVSILAMGGMYDIPNNQIVLKKAHERGVTYWDTADCYEGGRSETGIGKYFGDHPEVRKDIFLVSKSDARDPAGMEKLLDRTLERTKAGYVDLYFVHGISSISELSDDIKAYAARAKKEGKIKLFGFSTHKNMAQCLSDAAKTDWIDGVMFTYNYRLMRDADMNAALDACATAGIGLTAMKTQGGGQVKVPTTTEQDVAGKFLERGFTEHQAKIKAVWSDERISAICSQMPNLGILMSNVAAALDQTKLAEEELEILQKYAAETGCGYCAGCSHLCTAAIGGAVPISEVMRALMYRNSYGNSSLARETFASLPEPARKTLTGLDYTEAERICPQRMPIAKLMREAADMLA